jgi:hypothetical protein
MRACPWCGITVEDTEEQCPLCGAGVPDPDARRRRWRMLWVLLLGEFLLLGVLAF